jgi:hypothetical protein
LLLPRPPRIIELYTFALFEMLTYVIQYHVLLVVHFSCG